MHEFKETAMELMTSPWDEESVEIDSAALNTIADFLQT